jgi:CDGSH iron-sulfur domain-containing protein 1
MGRPLANDGPDPHSNVMPSDGPGMPRIVEIKDQTPLLIRPEDTVNGIVAVCRCGLSSNWPYCNGTHKATIGEDPQKLYHYDRELPQGTPRRHEVDLEAVEHEWKQEVHAKQPDDDGHAADAAPARPPRPPGHHTAPQPAGKESLQER